MPGSPSNQPPPSYVDGRFRDPEIERQQDPKFSKDDLDRAIRAALPQPKKKRKVTS